MFGSTITDVKQTLLGLQDMLQGDIQLTATGHSLIHNQEERCGRTTTVP